jgi:molybdopterin synthase catalytic subunit
MDNRWTIHLFAGLAERLGTSVLTFSGEAETMKVSELKQVLVARFPEHADIVRVSFIARNQQYASDQDSIYLSDELAMLPPVSGGEDTEVIIEQNAAGNERYFITSESLSAEAIASLVITPAHGASLVFIGTTREWTQGKRTVRLEYEAYAPMAVRTMRQIGEEIAERWPGALCAIGHRIGVVDLAGISVVIAVSAPHRDDCYAASRYAIERLKQIVPIWKKEIWEDGSEWKGHQQGPWNPISEPTA